MSEFIKQLMGVFIGYIYLWLLILYEMGVRFWLRFDLTICFNGLFFYLPNRFIIYYWCLRLFARSNVIYFAGKYCYKFNSMCFRTLVYGLLESNINYVKNLCYKFYSLHYIAILKFLQFYQSPVQFFLNKIIYVSGYSSCCTDF